MWMTFSLGELREERECVGRCAKEEENEEGMEGVKASMVGG